MTTVIDRPIVSAEVVTEGSVDALRASVAEPHLPPPPPPAFLTYERPEVVSGKTYKIKPPTIDSAMYITINDIALPDGTRRPLEVFINTKHAPHYQWIMGMTRMISAIFRKIGPYEFVIDELEQVFDPQGGYFQGQSMCPSVVAHLGKILRRHCEDIGAIEKRGLVVPPEAAPVIKELLAEPEFSHEPG